MNAILNYIKASKSELEKVTWLTRDQVTKSTVLVIVVSLIIAIFLGAMDYGLNKLLEYLIA